MLKKSEYEGDRKLINVCGKQLFRRMATGALCKLVILFVGVSHVWKTGHRLHRLYASNISNVSVYRDRSLLGRATSMPVAFSRTCSQASSLESHLFVFTQQTI